ATEPPTRASSSACAASWTVSRHSSPTRDDSGPSQAGMDGLAVAVVPPERRMPGPHESGVGVQLTARPQPVSGLSQPFAYAIRLLTYYIRSFRSVLVPRPP